VSQAKNGQPSDAEKANDAEGLSPPQQAPGIMERADLLTGIVLMVLGVAVAWMSWEMPRLEARRIHPSTVPGLVPGILGVTLAFCGAILALRSVRASADAQGWRSFGGIFVSPEAGRVGTALALALIYALVLVGTVPFWAATALFVFAFIVIFERGFSASRFPLWRTLLTAAVQAVIVGVAVTLVFELGFLVRLP